MATQPRPALDTLGKLWPMLLALVMIASAWGVMQTQAATHERRICALEDRYRESLTVIGVMSERVARIETKLDYLTSELARRGTASAPAQ